MAFLIVLVAACGEPLGGPPITGNDYKVYEAAVTSKSEVIEVIDSRTQRVERTLPMGTLSTDLRHLYSVVSSRLDDFDPQTGSTLHSLPLPRTYWLPSTSMNSTLGGLSQNGKWLALQSWDPADVSWPDSSHFLVASTGFDLTPVRIDLKGWFEFDAISNDGKRLYLIESLARGVYRVRVYDVFERSLDPTVVVDKTDPKETMSGARVMAVPAPNGHFLYSLYVREKSGPFIHALNLDGPIALCIDLPGPGYGSSADAFGWSLALAGDTLYASNAALGVVDTVDLGSDGPKLSRTASITSGSPTAGVIPSVEAKEMGGGSLLSRDGKTLVTAGNDGLTLVDTTALRVRSRTLQSSRIEGLGLTIDGTTIYAATADRKIAEVAVASARIGEMFDPGGGMPLAILAVSGAPA